MRPEEDPDLGWVEELSGGPQAAVATAVEEARGAHGLYRHLEREHRAEGRRSYIEIDAPLELHALVQLLRPQHLIEVGVSSGVSSAYLLDALDRNGMGTLHSVDLPSVEKPKKSPPRSVKASWTLPPGRCPGWAVPMKLRRRWDLRLGDKAAVLPILAAELPQVDMFVYDVPHDDRAARQEFQLFTKLLSPGGVVIADHGPGGGLCAGLRGWARAAGAVPTRRSGLGLYGFRRP